MSRVFPLMAGVVVLSCAPARGQTVNLTADAPIRDLERVPPSVGALPRPLPAAPLSPWAEYRAGRRPHPWLTDRAAPPPAGGWVLPPSIPGVRPVVRPWIGWGPAPSPAPVPFGPPPAEGPTFALGRPAEPTRPAAPTGGSGVGQFVSSNTGSNAFNGLNVNQFLGANAFYQAGYTGSQAVVANIEAGHVWAGHESLGHVTTFLNGPGTVAALLGVTAATDRHATWAGQAIGGRPTAVGGAEYQRGIAYGADLWSGAIATSWNLTAGDFSLSFNFLTYNAFFQPYVTAARTGVAGRTADVVNSSWGFSGDSAGRSTFSRGLDALARDTGKLFVFSAGNSGPGGNTVGGPATGYNVLSVAALGADTDASPYNVVSAFSSRGPQDVFVPTLSAAGVTGNTITGGRIRVDIAAPGQNLTLAYYGGATGGNAGNTGDGAANFYSFNVAGTSFAAPTVAGGATLLVDAGRQLALPNATDARVLKAVLLNAADKPLGWDNGQANVSGVTRTTQALDATTGAGRMNLAAAFPYYTAGTSTRGTSGVTAGGPAAAVAPLGYDFATAVQAGSLSASTSSYVFAGGGSGLTVTLTWFADRRVDSFTGPLVFSDSKLANLDLEVWAVAGDGTFTSKVAESASLYNNTEHLHLPSLAAGRYGFRVVYTGDAWDFVNSTTEGYAVAWNYAPVPEPAGLLAAAAIGLVIARRLRRPRNVQFTPMTHQ